MSAPSSNQPVSDVVVVGGGHNALVCAAYLAEAGIVRCDAIEPLDEGFRGGWITNPASIVHMLREPDAW